MQTEAYRQLYRKRSEVAEFPNAWLKEKLRLRRFRLRGMAKVAIESLWAVITYNLQQASGWVCGSNWQGGRHETVQEYRSDPDTPSKGAIECKLWRVPVFSTLLLLPKQK
jgi:hypothetical protein